MNLRSFSALMFSALILSAISFSTAAMAEDVSVSIESVGDLMKYNKTEITVPDQSKVTVSLKNKSVSLSHNWVLTVKGEADKIAMEGLAMGESKNYVDKNNKKIIAYIPIVKPGKSGNVTFNAPAKGTYDFLCTNPGHNVLMKGVFVVK